MKSNGSFIRDHRIHWSAHQRQIAREWARTHVTRERILDAALAAGTFGSTGFVLFVLHQALQNVTVTGL